MIKKQKEQKKGIEYVRYLMPCVLTERRIESFERCGVFACCSTAGAKKCWIRELSLSNNRKVSEAKAERSVAAGVA
jgi:hypothetical protein